MKLLYDFTVDKVANTIYLAQDFDETAAVSKWVIPAAHYLESWGDEMTPDGVASIQQPTIRRAQRAAVTDEGGEILGAAPQLLVEVVTEVAPDPRVGEPADAGEHQRHRQREEEREPDAKRNPHDASR